MSLSDSNTENTGGFREKTLTVRDHQDPDKHWIGESLAPPSQTEIAATVGFTAGPGDSPFVARADHIHKIDRYLLPTHFSSIGGAYTSSFSTENGVNYLTVSALPYAGVVYLWSVLRFDKSVATDFFVVRHREISFAGTMGCEYPLASQVLNVANLMSTWVLPANTSRTYHTSVLRVSGAGSGTTYSSAQYNSMYALWIQY